MALPAFHHGIVLLKRYSAAASVVDLKYASSFG